ncbi:hypothetical protein CHGG_01479 [Chaetomium globosum CBS 148.51]|jgi:phenol 2-monooxygenase|uniref:FAD-binding domain-containing protein n=1 Tax=Chaetomium globosum (strain ATCC 6205 / CBS 148.51 / DSM 1962 / NBRC 6347 / NRRL 1970) TaxID=306901 RepID=Q2HE75_CHAGB|nr:uncharacterized protein CHGG_01479 [Chaetomium globosum CBS 148.51]EAQ93244.1 hypothetical protein CHGG_01479 [Chaetomium globosum CBS 148.51]
MGFNTVPSEPSRGVGKGQMDTAACVDRLALLRSMPQAPLECQVCVVGAGPAGLMLACNLVRFGIKVEVVDDRADQTSVGRADGLQPKSIETFRQMRLADPLLQRGVRVYSISFWQSTADTPLKRLGREVHYPPFVDVIDPYVLLVHQGVVESVFIDDLKKRGIEIRRNTAFDSYSVCDDNRGFLQINCRTNVNQVPRSLLTRYLVGCDGAHSKVRGCIPGATSDGISQPALWGVLDGEVDTDFPDIWSKALVQSEKYGSIMVIPRERNVTRFYVELKNSPKADKNQLDEEAVMQRAREIMAPFRLEWDNIEWFGRYQVGQRIAHRFCDDHQRAFIAGDASHTHSPKSAQGMNTSMHDAWNLCWKLNLAIRGLAKPVLLQSYESERRKIALDLVNFDYEHAIRVAKGDPVALSENFRTNTRLISGVGADYGENAINMKEPIPNFIGKLQPGSLLPPGKVRRYIDSNPVDIQLDIPMLGQFRIYVIVWDVNQSVVFFDAFCRAITSPNSLLSQLSAAARASYTQQPRMPAPEDIYLRPERYTAVSHLFTFALITTMPQGEVEIQDLHPLFQDSRWTFYLDDVPQQDTCRMRCTDKWIGNALPGEVTIVNVRPDGYVGSIGQWDINVEDSGEKAARWLDQYYSRFLQVPVVMQAQA